MTIANSLLISPGEAFASSRFAANARSYGACAIVASTREELQDALRRAREHTATTVIVVETEKEVRVPGYESWWDVPVAEVSEVESVRAARERYDSAIKKERYFA